MRQFIWGVVFFSGLFSTCASAQDSTAVLTKADSIAVYYQVMQDLADLGFGAKSTADFTDISIGYGNGNFSQKAYLQTVSNKLPSGFFSLNGSYNHHSGLSFALNANVINEAAHVNLFQWSFSPAYDFINKKWSFGVAFYKYYNKDSLNFYVSPLVNELYGYVLLKKGWLQPKLAIDYGWGKYDERENLRYIDTNKYPRYKPLVRYLSKQLGVSSVNDFSILLSVRHKFSWYSKQKTKNYFQLTPVLSTTAGTSKYGSNLALTSSGTRVITSLTAQRFQTKYREFFPEPDDRFLLQNINASTTGVFNFGLFFIQSQLTLSYAFPKAYNGWNVYYNIGAGISF